MRGECSHHKATPLLLSILFWHINKVSIYAKLQKCCHGKMEFAIVLKLKNNFKKNIPAGKCNGCEWIHPENVAWFSSLIPINLAFSFFHFSRTTLLQLDVCVCLSINPSIRPSLRPCVPPLVRLPVSLRVSLHRGGGLQVGEVTRLGGMGWPACPYNLPF